MYLLGHEDVGEEEEVMSLAEFFKDGEEGYAGVVIVEVWEQVITTEGEEMVVAFGLVTLQAAGHGTSLWSRTGLRM